MNQDKICLHLKETLPMRDRILHLIGTIQPSHLDQYSKYCEVLIAKFPPKQNANKFIYGGINKHLLKHLFEQASHICAVVDDGLWIDQKTHLLVKTSKCSSHIIMTNYQSQRVADVVCYEITKNRVVLVIDFSDNYMYFVILHDIILNMEDFHQYFISNDSNLAMRKSILKRVPPELKLPLHVNGKGLHPQTSDICEELAARIIEETDKLGSVFHPPVESCPH